MMSRRHDEEPHGSDEAAGRRAFLVHGPVLGTLHGLDLWGVAWDDVDPWGRELL